MKTVFLIHEGPVQHYRISVYNYLYQYLKSRDIDLWLIAGHTQGDRPQQIRYPYFETRLRFRALKRLMDEKKPDAIIFWAKPHGYTYPLYLLMKRRNCKLIHWGHRRPLPPLRWLKLLAWNFDHWLDDAIILYADDFRRYVYRGFRSKIFIANNTLNLTETLPPQGSREDIKRRYGILTGKIIVYLGRIQRRRHLDHLVQAFGLLHLDDVGLVLAGTDEEGILSQIQGPNIFKLGPLYGEEALDLLSSSDVYCLPGAIGLSIVDAFFCGLPVVTEAGLHGPEIMYLKDGINGFIVAQGDIAQLAERLKRLLTDDRLRGQFSQAARQEILTAGHIDRLCEGFRDALAFVFRDS